MCVVEVSGCAAHVGHAYAQLGPRARTQNRRKVRRYVRIDQRKGMKMLLQRTIQALSIHFHTKNRSADIRAPSTIPARTPSARGARCW